MGLTISLALVYLTRYAGISLLATGVVVLMLDQQVNWREKGKKAIFLIGATVLLLLFSYIDRSTKIIQFRRDTPRGYGGPALRENLFEELLDLPQGTAIFTNNLELLYFFYGRIGLATPIPLDSVKMVQNPDYSKQVQEMSGQLLTGSYVLVIFPSGDRPSPVDWVEDLTLIGERNGLRFMQIVNLQLE